MENKSQSRGDVLQDRQVLMMKMKKELDETAEALSKLSLRTNMPIVQENGQRKYGPPIGETQVPLKGSEVFVGRLPRDCNETHIVPIFERVGKIHNIRMMMDFSGTNRGYCFVQYYNPQDASRAVLELNKHPIRPGRYIGVTKSVDNCRLYVGKIPRDKTKKEVFDVMNEITEGVIKVVCYASDKDLSRNCGYAFVEYATHRDAAMARRKLIPGNVQPWQGVKCKFDWADPEVKVKKLRNPSCKNFPNKTFSSSEQQYIGYPKSSQNFFDPNEYNDVTPYQYNMPIANGMYNAGDNQLPLPPYYAAGPPPPYCCNGFPQSPFYGGFPQSPLYQGGLFQNFGAFHPGSSASFHY